VLKIVMEIIITCEHGGNMIPAGLDNLFSGASEILDSHFGYDSGALDLADEISNFSADFFHSQFTRLAIDLNRSLSSRNLFSRYTKQCGQEIRNELRKNLYIPFREMVRCRINEIIDSGRDVLHISVHSFTPLFKNRRRNAQIGLLYDPSGTRENDMAKKIKNVFMEEAAALAVRFNYPYRGNSNSHIRDLKEEFPKGYCGLMIEVNQNLVRDNIMDRVVKRNISKGIEHILSDRP